MLANNFGFLPFLTFASQSTIMPPLFVHSRSALFPCLPLYSCNCNLLRTGADGCWGPFTQIIYPDKEFGLRGTLARPHNRTRGNQLRGCLVEMLCNIPV
ncbi:hypothetical protein BKA80DRAFT_59864 [Phyllosticta citrichinensis]